MLIFGQLIRPKYFCKDTLKFKKNMCIVLIFLNSIHFSLKQNKCDTLLIYIISNLQYVSINTILYKCNAFCTRYHVH